MNNKAFSNGEKYRFILEGLNGSSREMPPNMSSSDVKRIVDHIQGGGFVHVYEKIKTVYNGE